MTWVKLLIMAMVVIVNLYLFLSLLAKRRGGWVNLSVILFGRRFVAFMLDAAGAQYPHRR